jgi:hypothetical protein
MASKSDFDALIAWRAATGPSDPPASRRSVLATVQLVNPALDRAEHEWVGDVEYLDRQVHSVLGYFHGDIPAINHPEQSPRMNFWLSLAKADAWIGIVGAAHMPELGAAWREDVHIEVTRTGVGSDGPFVDFEAKADPDPVRWYFLINLSAKFQT